MLAPAGILHVPSRERVATSNAWAFLHLLRAGYGIVLSDWPALMDFAAAEPTIFKAAISAFARLPTAPIRIAPRRGPEEALVLRRSDGTRLALSRDTLAADRTEQLPAEIAALLSQAWPPASLIHPFAELLLHADLRPDDRMFVFGEAAWPWLAALTEGTTTILAGASPAELLALAAVERATVLAAPAASLSAAAFPRAGSRPDLGALKTVIAVGDPLSPEARVRIYTWVKSGIMLLARSGDRLWGSPLDPVPMYPAPALSFVKRRPSGPAPR